MGICLVVMLPAVWFECVLLVDEEILTTDTCLSLICHVSYMVTSVLPFRVSHTFTDVKVM